MEKNLEEMLKQCTECKHIDLCPARQLALYIKDEGVDYFLYQLKNNKLPKNIKSAFNMAILICLFHSKNS